MSATHIPIIGRLKLWELVMTLASAAIAVLSTADLCTLVASLPEPTPPGFRTSSAEWEAIFFTYPAILITGVLAFGSIVAFVVMVAFVIFRLRKAANEARACDVT